MRESFAEWRGDPVDIGPDAPERRADERHVAVRWPVRLVSGEVNEPCVVHTVSTTALIAEIFAPRSVDEEVRIELNGAQHLGGTVVWASDTNVEVRLHEPIDVSELVALHGGAPQAQPAELPRLEISCQGWLEFGNESFMVEVYDLSQGGARIAGHVAPTLGQRTRLVIEGLEPIAGEIRWRDDGKLGIAFDEPIPFDTLTGWIMEREAQIGSHGQARHWPRYSILMKTVARLPDVSEPVEAIVHNISRGGVLVTCRRGLHVGDHVGLGLGQAGQVAGRVVWVGGQNAGIQFSRTIDAGHVVRPLGGRGIAPVLNHHPVGRRPGLNSHKAH